jgi:hypothetical protein
VIAIARRDRKTERRIVFADDAPLAHLDSSKRASARGKFAIFVASLNNDCLSASQAAWGAEPFDAAVQEPHRPRRSEGGLTDALLRAFRRQRQRVRVYLGIVQLP